MSIKTLLSDIKFLLRRTFPIYTASAIIIIAARLMLSFSNGIAEGSRPPVPDTVASYVAYFGVLLNFIIIFAITVVFLKNIILSADVMPYKEMLSHLVTTAIFNIFAYLLFFGGTLLLSFDGSYFDYYFSNLVPPLSYNPSRIYGWPMMLYSLLAVSVIIISLPVLLSAGFAFARKFKKTSIPTIGAFIILYAAALIIFILMIMADFPPAAWFTGYMLSGNYAHIISAYLAIAISVFIVAIPSFFLTGFFIKKANTKEGKKHK